MNKQPDELVSPCVRNCCLDQNDICIGCFRHIDEIVGWQNLPDEKKKTIVELCRQRKDSTNQKL